MSQDPQQAPPLTWAALLRATARIEQARRAGQAPDPGDVAYYRRFMAAFPRGGRRRRRH